MNIDFQEILKELEFRVPNGIINLNENSQVTTLVDILRENGVSDPNEIAQKARVYFSYVSEANKKIFAKPKKKAAPQKPKSPSSGETLVVNKKTGNVYPVKNFNSTKHTKASEEDIAKAKAAGKFGQQKPKSSAKPKKQEPKPATISVSTAEKRTAEKKRKPTSFDERLDSNSSENIVKTYNTNKTYTESGKDYPTHKDRIKLLESKKVPKIKGVAVTEYDVYNAMGIKKGECKFPSKYISVIALALTHSKGGYTITDLTDAAGAGTLDSTLGELMILMGSTIQDEKARANFYNFLRQNVEKGGKQSPITREWVDAAENSCTAFDRKLKKNCGGGYSVQGNFWDIEKEADGAGVKNYKRDKGKSTDINTIVNCTSKDGKTTQIWQQPSLKKSKDVQAMNGTTSRVHSITLNRYGTKEEKALYSKCGNELDSYKGLDKKAIISIKDESGKSVNTTIEKRTKELNSIMERLEHSYDKYIPDSAKPGKATERQKKLHDSLSKDKNAIKEMNKFFTDWQSMGKSERQELCKQISRKRLSQKGEGYEKELSDKFTKLSEYEINTPEKFDEVIGEVLGLSGKEKSKFMIASMNAVEMANEGKQTVCGEYRKKLLKNSHDHSKAVLDYLIKDEENKKSLLDNIGQTFPLKELMEGKEWAILGEKGGGINLDKDTISQCLGAANFEDVVQKLQIVNYGDKKEPTLVYSADNGKRNIPISKINCRPDGIGYGTTWKLEMDIHDGFADCCKSHDK